MRAEGLFRSSSKLQLDDAIHAGRRLADGHNVLGAYERLIQQVLTRSTLLHPSDRPGDARECFHAALVALALYQGDWLRPIHEWTPRERNPYPAFASLAQHLLARVPVPAFMTSAWLDLPSGRPWDERRPQQEWYLRLGRGENIRDARLPLRLTRAMAHLFTQAPHHFTAIAAIRWAQVLGLGGSKSLARAVIATRLGKTLENEDFWETVLQFFVNHPTLDLADIGPVVDFLQHQRFEWKEGVSPEGVFGRLPPPRPDYAMKGRTTASLLRQVNEWHAELRRLGNGPSVTWPASPFREFRLVEGPPGASRVWTITELLTSNALVAEGQAMRHCVATYRADCERREVAIWSMRVQTRLGVRRALTLEVNLHTRTIVQMRGACNRFPGAGERALVERWAAAEGLAMSEFLS